MTPIDTDFLSLLDVEDALEDIRRNQYLLVCLDRCIGDHFDPLNPGLKEALDRITTVLEAYDLETVNATLALCLKSLERIRQQSRCRVGVNPPS